jgi:hypothetical protein
MYIHEIMLLIMNIIVNITYSFLIVKIGGKQKYHKNGKIYPNETVDAGAPFIPGLLYGLRPAGPAGLLADGTGLLRSPAFQPGPCRHTP